jgi:phage terminase small subunit
MNKPQLLAYLDEIESQMHNESFTRAAYLLGRLRCKVADHYEQKTQEQPKQEEQEACQNECDEDCLDCKMADKIEKLLKALS